MITNLQVRTRRGITWAIRPQVEKHIFEDASASRNRRAQGLDQAAVEESRRGGPGRSIPPSFGQRLPPSGGRKRREALTYHGIRGPCGHPLLKGGVVSVAKLDLTWSRAGVDWVALEVGETPTDFRPM